MQSTYADFTKNTEVLDLDTEYTTLAVQVYFAAGPDGSVVDLDPESIARIQFYQTVKTPENLTTSWIGAARCKDIYANEMINS